MKRLGHKEFLEERPFSTFFNIGAHSTALLPAVCRVRYSLEIQETTGVKGQLLRLQICTMQHRPQLVRKALPSTTVHADYRSVLDAT